MRSKSRLAEQYSLRWTVGLAELGRSRLEALEHAGTGVCCAGRPYCRFHKWRANYSNGLGFASGSAQKPKVRIWNRQLIGYAGYLRADGSVLGDPINLNFTQRIQALGWKGPSPGRFNLLPIAIEMDGAVHWFDLPDVVLEVPIRHPRYDWFERLGLKWFALPAVSAMRLEIGGVSFPAAPFSGWYLGTEIGARG